MLSFQRVNQSLTRRWWIPLGSPTWPLIHKDDAGHYQTSVGLTYALITFGCRWPIRQPNRDKIVLVDGDLWRFDQQGTPVLAIAVWTLPDPEWRAGYLAANAVPYPTTSREEQAAPYAHQVWMARLKEYNETLDRLTFGARHPNFQPLLTERTTQAGFLRRLERLPELIDNARMVEAL